MTCDYMDVDKWVDISSKVYGRYWGNHLECTINGIVVELHQHCVDSHINLQFKPPFLKVVPYSEQYNVEVGGYTVVEGEDLKDMWDTLVKKCDAECDAKRKTTVEKACGKGNTP